MINHDTTYARNYGQRTRYVNECNNDSHLCDVTGVNEYDRQNNENIINSSEHCLKNIKLLSLNVCGLTSKQVYPEFKSLINDHDIIGFQESKMDSLDSLNIENYTLFFKHRKALSKRKSGGIALAVKDSIRPYVSIIETESRLVYWFVISKRYTKTDDILCGIIYVPPENSIYAVQDPFLEIQREIDSFSNKHNNFCIFGDARTKLLKDYIEVDNDIFKIQYLKKSMKNLRLKCIVFKIKMYRQK